MEKQHTQLKPIDAPVYGYWKALYLSFYSKRLYIDVGKRWKGFAIRYLLLVIALWSIPFAIKLCMDFNELYKEQILEPLASIPTLYIQNGQISFDKPMPYFIKNTKGKVALVVDTTGSITDFSDKKYPDLTIIINKNSISFLPPKPRFLGALEEEQVNTASNPPLVQSFGKDDNMVFDGNKMIEQSSMNQLKLAAQAIFYPIVFATLFTIFLSTFLVLGFLGQIFSRIFFSFQITIKQGIRLLTVAATPTMLVLLILLTFNLTFYGYGYFLMVILSAFFAFSVYSLRSESKRIASA